ncbi:MAG TPA: efflux RND transporter periplasmic adaptor subunit, partial [Chloroflexota bacterium]
MAQSAPHSRAWMPGRFPVGLATLALALMLALAIAYVAVLGDPFSHSTPAPTYQTAQATQGSVQVTVSATGPVTTVASVPLTFKTSGQLSEIDVAVGQTVTAGQVLAKEDTSDLQAAVDQAQATLQQQQANLAKIVAGATPQTQGAAQAQVDAAQTTLTGAQKNLDATRTSTTSGLITLADLSTPQVAASVSEADIGKVQVGQKATFTLTAYPDQTFTGTVAAIEPAGTT